MPLIYLFLWLHAHNTMVSNWLHAMIDDSSTLNIFMTPTMMCIGLTTVPYMVLYRRAMYHNKAILRKSWLVTTTKGHLMVLYGSTDRILIQDNW
jgi:hypothetical protein